MFCDVHDRQDNKILGMLRANPVANDGDKFYSRYHETDNNVDIGIGIDIDIDMKEKVEEGSSEKHNVNAIVDNNDNIDTDDSSINSNNDNNSDDDLVERNDDKTKDNSSCKVSVNAKTTNTCLSPTYLEVDGIDKDEDGTMYVDEDDTPMGVDDDDDDDDNDEPTKRTHDAQWMEMYQKLVAYNKQYRSIKVPQQYTEDRQLGQWGKYSTSGLQEEQII